METASGHLLSLKVMRVSRPSVSAAWQPFFSSSPSFSAHSSASILSLQGEKPLEGHPKTLRDLTHVSEMLTLPSTFGSIQLGETFCSCLCVNNDTTLEIEGVSLKVEMHTATSKVLIAEAGGPDHKLQAAEFLEAVVLHEIKELGQHVLACTVSYKLPDSIRYGPSPAPDPYNPRGQVYNKYYKFPVTNPLSVKTKAHAPRSPSALLSRTEREKVFLEVHIQNLTAEAMWFERIVLECAEGWAAQDANTMKDEATQEAVSIFSGPTALMQPQDIRTYVYILTPLSVPSFVVNPPPGSIIPLGRLDITWRTAFGEPGRLLTSMLSRRIPLPPSAPAAAAIPPHLQQRTTILPPRPSTPSQVAPGSPNLGKPLSRPSSPVPYKSRSPRPQSPIISAFVQPIAPPPPPTDLEVDLVVNYIERENIKVEVPFTIKCSLALSGLITPRQVRYVHIAIQHVQPARTQESAPATSNLHIILDPPRHSTILSQVASSGFSTPSPTATPRRGQFNFDSDRAAFADSPHGMHSLPSHPGDSATGTDGRKTIHLRSVTTMLPAPFAEVAKEPYPDRHKMGEVEYLGASTLTLPPFKLTQEVPEGLDTTENAPLSTRVHTSHDFELEFFPLKRGFVHIGALRVLVLSDGESEEMDHNHTEGAGVVGKEPGVNNLKEWDVIAEIWVN